MKNNLRVRLMNLSYPNFLSISSFAATSVKIPIATKISDKRHQIVLAEDSTQLKV